MGRVTFGRPPTAKHGVFSLDLSIDGVKAAVIDDGQYASLLVEMGEHDIKVASTIAGASVPKLSFSRRITVVERKDVYIEFVKPGTFSLDFSSLFSIQSDSRLNYGLMSKVPPIYAALYNDGTRALVGEAIRSPFAQPPAQSQLAAQAQAPASGTPAQVPKGSSVLAGNVIAVVIGNRDYERGTSADTFAQNDARAFREALEKSFGIDEKDIWQTENAGLADLISLFGGSGSYKMSRVYRAASLRDTPTDLIVYYSGHGAPATSGQNKGEGYLVPVDADLQDIQDTGYAIGTLMANVEAMKADGVIDRSWLSFDACFSGQGGDGSFLVKNVSGLAVQPLAPSSYPKDGIVMFASSGEEFASWYPEKEHGLFTYFLLKGLSGEADTDGNGSISPVELGSYLRKWVPRYANGLNAQEQTPQVIENGEMEGFLSLGK